MARSNAIPLFPYVFVLRLPLVVFLFLFLSVSVVAQQRHLVQGVLSDSETGEPVVFANCVVTPSGAGAVSNSSGRFSIQAPAGESSLVVSCIGYQSVSLPLRLVADTLVFVSLRPLDQSIDEVVVTSSTPMVEQLRMSKVTVPISMMQRMPSFSGQPDVLKAITFIPGVSGGKEGSASLFVRGGDRGQNLVLLDGIRIYNPSHYFGLVSLFNPDVVKHVDVYKGAFPAQYGGRVSSVVDVVSKDGNVNHFSGNVSLGMLSSSLFVEGPISSKASFHVAARGEFYDVVTDLKRRDVRNADVHDPVAFPKHSDPNACCYGSFPFFDANARVVWHPTPSSNLAFSFFHASDRISNGEAYVEGRLDNVSSLEKRVLSLKVDNTGGAISFGTALGNVFWRSTLSVTDYSNRLSDENWLNDLDFKKITHSVTGTSSGITDVSLHSHADMTVGSHHARAGLEVVYFSFSPGSDFRSASEEVSGWHTDSVCGSSARLGATECSLYLADEYSLTHSLLFEPGVRATLFSAPDATFRRVEPRFALRQVFADHFSVKASYSTMNQFSHTFVNISEGLENEVSLPASRAFAPEQSRQVALGLFYADESRHQNFSIEGYYKRMTDLCFYHPTAMLTMGSVADIKSRAVAHGRGRGYGVEFLGAKDFRKASLSLSYSLSVSERRFRGINRGAWFPSDFDRRHDLSLVSLFKFDERWSAGANFTLASGALATLPVAKVPVTQIGSHYMVYDHINNYHFPTYHRLDVNFIRDISARHTHQRLVLGVYNVYGRHNPSAVRARGNTDKVELLSFYSVLPAISYSIFF